VSVEQHAHGHSSQAASSSAGSASKNARVSLSRLIERACAGEEVVIARGKTPVVKLVPTGSPAPHRQFGAMRGRARVRYSALRLEVESLLEADREAGTSSKRRL
jgi:antitoxin (DNA-binding transcriptional repressor) of toxin-antitoxin stability system